jgi:hypothetical protein
MLLLPFKAMLLLERARRRKSGGPPLLAPSFKVKRDVHSQRSGFAVAPSTGGVNARGPLKVHPKWRLEESAKAPRAVPRIDRHIARKPDAHRRASLSHGGARCPACGRALCSRR